MATIDRSSPAMLSGLTELRRMVGPDPHRPGPDRARLVVENVPVWAIVGHVLALGGVADPERVETAVLDQVAVDFAISPSGVVAALLYYAEHRDAIDTLLAGNAAAMA